MLLHLKNIGKVADANIEIKAITVIAGENNTGKSTLGKVLFCIFNSFYVTEQQIFIERQDSISELLNSVYRDITNRLTIRVNTDHVSEKILENADVYVNDIELLKLNITKFMLTSDASYGKYNNDNAWYALSEKVINVLKVSDEEIFKTVLQKKLDSEFNEQINNIYSTDDGEINLTIKEDKVKILIRENIVQGISNRLSLNTEVVYIDDPFVIDGLSMYPFFINFYESHRTSLQRKLSKNDEPSIKNALNEIIVSKKLDLILDKINAVCNGEIIQKSPFSFGYKRNSSDAVLDIKNVSTGLKTFVILKTLLLNGSIEDNGTIVLDEPEIHLHPEWQLVFAELIVLIQKEFGLHVLLNTHSPYFLNAIEVYAAKYGLADKCKYYLAENGPDGEAVIFDVSSDVDKIYEKLARPLQKLENERFHNV